MTLYTDRTHPIDVLMASGVPSYFSPERFVNLSLFYPGAAAEREGYNVEYWDGRFDSYDRFKELISKSKVVAFSSMSGTQLLETIKLAEMTRKISCFTRIILGGVHSTTVKGECLADNNLFDYIVMSEGEQRLVQLLSHIFHEEDITKIDGVGYRSKDGTIIIQDPAENLELEDTKEFTEVLPDGTVQVHPAKKGWYVSPITAKNERYYEMSVPMLPSRRGCPYRCSFCSVPSQYVGRSSREIPFDYWREDVDKMLSLWERKNPRLKIFELNDENSLAANAMKKYMLHLKDKGIETHLHIRADQLRNRKNVQAFKDYGCARVHIGIESGNERVLRNVYLKDATPDVYREVAYILKEVGIMMVGTAVVGAPTETRQEMFDTLNLLDELDLLMNPNPGFRSTVYTLIALPSCSIYDLAKREGWKLPSTTHEWARFSAADNPFSKYTSSIYLASGLWYNRWPGGKTDRNFGKDRWLIRLFELLSHWRHKHRLYDFYSLEKFFIEKLISWKSKGNRDHDIVMSESLSAGVVKTGW